MAVGKFYGPIGYGQNVEGRPGAILKTITERKLYGDVIRNSRTLASNEKVNGDISVGVTISVVADAYAIEHFYAIQYVYWQGVRWVVANVTPEPPRLLLRLGGVYNGPTPDDNPPAGAPN